MQGVVEADPALVFEEAGFFDVFGGGAAFLEAGEDDGELLAGEFEVQAGDVAGGFSVAPG